METILNYNTQIAGAQTAAVRHAADHLLRDMKKVFCETTSPGCQILLEEGKILNKFMHLRTLTSDAFFCKAFCVEGKIDGLRIFVSRTFRDEHTIT